MKTSNNKIYQKLDGLSGHLITVIENLLSPSFDKLSAEEKAAAINKAKTVKDLGDVLVKSAAIECKHKELDLQQESKPIPINGRTVKELG